ncbi:MAG: flagellar basal body P-ring formation protein FlgA [Rhizobiales bacterium]|nr:flagellar basal body P-ring formation protein FlgA [Hyphomicrobiales bacterium]
MIRLVLRTRSSRTPCGKFDRELRVQRGARIIELPVVLRFRSSYLNVRRKLTNFGIGPLATLSLLALTLPAFAQVASTNGSFADRFAAHAPLSQQIAGPALKPAVTIVGEIVRIGDLVENAGAAAHVAIFRAPDLGHTGRVAVARVIEAVLPHEIVNLETRGLTDVVVTRASAMITPKEIETRITQALAGRQRNADASNLTLTFDSEPRTIHVEPGTELRIARLAFDPRSGRFDVVFERPGNRNLLRFTGTYAETFEAAVLARPVAAGEVLRAADVNIVRRPKAEFTANIIIAADQAIGLAARRAMRPGDVLRQTDLAKAQVVARNDNVTIVYQVPGVTLTMRGKALEGGAQGDTIGVLNMQSKRSVQGTIAGPGHVVVSGTTLVSVTPTTTTPRLAANASGRSSPNNQARASAHPNNHARASAE